MPNAVLKEQKADRFQAQFSANGFQLSFVLISVLSIRTMPIASGTSSVLVVASTSYS
jgi:hypothetical protein